MDESIARFLEDLVARTQGPMWFRLILQPLVAIVSGILAGLRNARGSRRAGGPHRHLDPAFRGEMLRQAWNDLGKVVLIGVALDVIVQWIVLRTVHPGETLLIVMLIVVIPYQIIRTAVARIARGRQPPGAP